MTLPINQIIQGDCLEVMKTWPDNCIDSIITDPPYGLNFLGKKWDYEVPIVESWQECLRVLKPGGTLLCFAGSRTSHRMACNIEDAGFLLFDTIMYLYGSGFPKSTNISKQIDKRAGTYVKGKLSPNSRNSGASPSGCYGEGVQCKTLSNPQCEQAKQWDGWGTHLKPAFEPIICARKSNDGTYANNALKYGVAGLNIDGGRIKHHEDSTKICKRKAAPNNVIGLGFKKHDNEFPEYNAKGRFPANLLLDKNVTTENWKRYFYCAKASKAERNAGCEGLEVKHPTVKPIALMRYLCKLTATPTGGLVLDPFMGSGTTGAACALTGREFIGIEKEAEYCQIARARIKEAKQQHALFEGVV